MNDNVPVVLRNNEHDGIMIERDDCWGEIAEASLTKLEADVTQNQEEREPDNSERPDCTKTSDLASELKEKRSAARNALREKAKR